MGLGEATEIAVGDRSEVYAMGKPLKYGQLTIYRWKGGKTWKNQYKEAA